MRINVDDKILDKIAKLLALANSPNENEAQVAMSKAVELLAKYNLSMADWDNATRQSESTVDEEYIQSMFMPWKHSLLSILCDYSFCRAYKVKDNGRRKLMVVGSRVNRSAVILMFNYLVTVIHDLTEFEFKKSGFTCSPGTDTVWKDSFRFGVLQRLKERLDEQEKVTAQESQASSALALFDLQTSVQASIDEYLRSQGWKISFSKKSTKHFINHSAADIGYDRGGDVSLNPLGTLRS